MCEIPSAVQILGVRRMADPFNPRRDECAETRSFELSHAKEIFSACFRNRLLLINEGDYWRNSERNSSGFYWRPPKNFKLKETPNEQVSVHS
jgi:hypothetical protein